MHSYYTGEHAVLRDNCHPSLLLIPIKREHKPVCRERQNVSATHHQQTISFSAFLIKCLYPRPTAKRNKMTILWHRGNNHQNKLSPFYYAIPKAKHSFPSRTPSRQNRHDATVHTHNLHTFRIQKRERRKRRWFQPPSATRSPAQGSVGKVTLCL